MDNKLFFTLVIVCSITHIVRTVYELLKDKKKLIPGKLSFVIILINMLLLWVSWFVLCSLDIYTINLGIISYLGIIFIVTGVIVFLTALFTIKSLESYEGSLITSGIYSKIRHPMYLGFILWLLGFPIYFGAIFSFTLSFLFIANVLFWKSLEEKELVNRFSDYAEYKKKTYF